MNWLRKCADTAFCMRLPDRAVIACLFLRITWRFLAIKKIGRLQAALQKLSNLSFDNQQNLLF